MTTVDPYGIPDWDRVCAALHLPRLLRPPQRVVGGHTHRVWRLDMAEGTVAVKHLNPVVTARPGALEDVLFGEMVARSLHERGIPAVPAFASGGSPICQVDGDFFLDYDWTYGTVATVHDVQTHTAMQIGTTVAKIHALHMQCDSVSQPDRTSFSSEHWSLLVELCELGRIETAPILKAHLPRIIQCSDAYEESAPALAERVLISHRDLDRKNVILTKDGLAIIDWEGAGYINPAQEIFGVALDWSSNGRGKLNLKLMRLIFGAYFVAGGVFPEPATDVIASQYGATLDWLEFNIRRSLGDESTGKDDRFLGLEQTISSIQKLVMMDSYSHDLLNMYDEAARIRGTR